MHQEMIEILYHTLWETVHVFFEHRELGHDVGDAGFLYPFLGQQKQETGERGGRSGGLDPDESARMTRRCARRSREEQAEQICERRAAIHERLRRGGKLILFGNGGSATDANDWALDCVHPPAGLPCPFPRFRFRWNPPISPRSPTMSAPS